MEKEIKKAIIPTVDTGENPEVPFPRDMIDLEVINITHHLFVIVFDRSIGTLVILYTHPTQHLLRYDWSVALNFASLMPTVPLSRQFWIQ